MRRLDYGHAFLCSAEEIHLIRQWFNAVQDIHPGYLTTEDYTLVKEVHEALDMRVPDSVNRRLERPPIMSLGEILAGEAEEQEQPTRKAVTVTPVAVEPPPPPPKPICCSDKSHLIAHDLGFIPAGKFYSCDDTTTRLSEFDLKELKAAGIDEAWYWYTSGCYEGVGQLLMRKGSEYDIHDMGHCSCYGPCEVEFNGQYKTLDDIQPRCSAEAWAAIAPLVDMARKCGHEAPS